MRVLKILKIGLVLTNYVENMRKRHYKGIIFEFFFEEIALYLHRN